MKNLEAELVPSKKKSLFKDKNAETGQAKKVSFGQTAEAPIVHEFIKQNPISGLEKIDSVDEGPSLSKESKIEAVLLPPERSKRITVEQARKDIDEIMARMSLKEEEFRIKHSVVPNENEWSEESDLSEVDEDKRITAINNPLSFEVNYDDNPVLTTSFKNSGKFDLMNTNFLGSEADNKVIQNFVEDETEAYREFISLSATNNDEAYVSADNSDWDNLDKNKRITKPHKGFSRFNTPLKEIEMITNNVRRTSNSVQTDDLTERLIASRNIEDRKSIMEADRDVMLKYVEEMLEQKVEQKKMLQQQLEFYESQVEEETNKLRLIENECLYLEEQEVTQEDMILSSGGTTFSFNNSFLRIWLFDCCCVKIAFSKELTFEEWAEGKVTGIEEISVRFAEDYSMCFEGSSNLDRLTEYFRHNLDKILPKEKWDKINKNTIDEQLPRLLQIGGRLVLLLEILVFIKFEFNDFNFILSEDFEKAKLILEFGFLNNSNVFLFFNWGLNEVTEDIEYDKLEINVQDSKLNSESRKFLLELNLSIKEHLKTVERENPNFFLEFLNMLLDLIRKEITE